MNSPKTCQEGFPMPRRGSNIYKRKDGRFEGRVPIGHKEDGSLKYKFVYARTLSEVKEKMAQFQAVLQLCAL